MERRGEVISVAALLLGAGAVWHRGLLGNMPAAMCHRRSTAPMEVTEQKQIEGAKRATRCDERTREEAVYCTLR
jgi:hypothetical protein